jgi:hypothetical protein
LGFIRPISTLFLISALYAGSASAQSCALFPAECPVNGADSYGSSDDSISRLDNPVIPEEITMENRLRHWMATTLGRIANNQGWQLVQISEGGSSGFRAADESVLKYPLRPPHWYTTTWEFVVNKDSLKAWNDWLMQFGQQRLDKLNQNAANQMNAYDRTAPYRDSVDHYTQLMGQYMQDHMAQYQKDLVAGNKAGISSYEKAVAAYQKRSDYFSQKIGDMSRDAGAEKDDADAETLRKKQTIHFRDATVLIVEVEFNNEYAKTAGSATGFAAGAPIWFSNPEPDPIAVDFFNRSRTSVLLLEGDWNTKSDQYGGYRPAFYSNKASIDKTTPKRIKSDQVQAIDIHLSGNQQAMRKFLAALPRGELAALITR